MSDQNEPVQTDRADAFFEEEDEPKLSWLTRIAFMLGIGVPPTGAAMAEAEAKEFEAAVRSRLPEHVRTGDVLGLVFYPSPILKIPSVPVVLGDGGTKVKDLRSLVRSLGATMYLCGGVGLSAIQVGIPIRVIVADLGKLGDGMGRFRVYVNPRIVAQSKTMAKFEEGCLSMPSVHEKVDRPEAVTVTALDIDGVEFTEALDGWPARVFLHEYDHLEGKTMMDRMGSIQRRFAEKAIDKLRRNIEHSEENAVRRTQARR